MPVWGASPYSKKGRGGNLCSEPFAFSAVNVTSPICPYGDRLSRGGSSTRCEPPQAIPAKMKRTRSTATSGRPGGGGGGNGGVLGEPRAQGGTNQKKKAGGGGHPGGGR